MDPQYEKKIKVELYHDHFENSKQYNIPRAQLIIADIPYNLGNNAYASNPSWYVDGDNSNGESDKAGKSFFKTDENFKIGNFFDFCVRLLKPEPKGTNEAPCMIIFCAFEQMHYVIDPVAGSGTTLRAAAELGRSAYGFEIERKFYKMAQEKMLSNIPIYKPMELDFGTIIQQKQLSLFDEGVE